MFWRCTLSDCGGLKAVASWTVKRGRNAYGLRLRSIYAPGAFKVGSTEYTQRLLLWRGGGGDTSDFRVAIMIN